MKGRVDPSGHKHLGPPGATHTGLRQNNERNPDFHGRQAGGPTQSFLQGKGWRGASSLRVEGTGVHGLWRKDPAVHGPRAGHLP